jgi:hypothetical protein
MNAADAVLMEGELESKSFLWNKRRFVLRSNSTFSRYNGPDLRHSAAITDTTSVSVTGSREFVLTFTELELCYRIRAGSSDERDRWVAALQACIARTSPAPAVNFATEWLDECNRVCPKSVDYATCCPKGHALVPFADGGGRAPAQRLMCRICHEFTERQQALLWLVCSVAGCCGGYTVCDTCVGALQQAPASAAASHDSPSLVRTVAHVVVLLPVAFVMLARYSALLSRTCVG